MYAVDESGMEAELLREFASNINSDTDYTLRIMDISRDGLLSLSKDLAVSQEQIAVSSIKAK